MGTPSTVAGLSLALLLALPAATEPACFKHTDAFGTEDAGKSDWGPRVHGTAAFEVEPPDPPYVMVSAGDLGAHPSNTDNHAPFMRSIDACRAKGAAVLRIPKGAYRFAGGRTVEFRGLTNFTLDGEGSELVNGPALTNRPLLQFTACSRVRVKNLSLDWAWDRQSLASIVEIAALNRAERSMDLRFREAPRYEGDRIPFYNLVPVHPETLSPDFRFFAGMAESASKLQPERIWLPSGLLRLTARADLADYDRLKVGAVYQFRHFAYGGGGLYLVDSAHVSLSNVHVWGAIGFGFCISGRTHHLGFRACSVARRPGTSRPISTTADHVHMVSSQGYFRFEDCEFAWGGDDGMNLKARSAQGVRPDGAGKLLLNTRTPQLYSAGDLLEFRLPDLTPSGYRATLRAVTTGADPTLLGLTLDPAPPDLPADSVVFNRSFDSSHFIIRGCHFHDLRGRGILLQGSHALIESNVFERTTGGPVAPEVNVEPRWQEGYGVSNVLIRGNRFLECPPLGSKAFVQGRVAAPGLLTDIRIEGNTFENRHPARPAMHLDSLMRVQVVGNTFRSFPAEAEGAERSALRLTRCARVRVEGNLWVAAAPRTNAIVCADAESRNGLVLRANLSAVE